MCIRDRVKAEEIVVFMEIFHFENDFKYKSSNMEVMYGSPYRYFYLEYHTKYISLLLGHYNIK